MLRIGSLFAGLGGIDLGFEQAGFIPVWANEFDADACKTFKLNFPDVALTEGDIRSVNPGELPKVDVLTAGFPCQPFSVCGRKKGFEDPRGNLFFEIMRFADALQPEVIFLENVANLTEHDEGRTFRVICDELTSRGYTLRHMTADACDFNVPQHRTRIYIVAFKSEKAANLFVFPQKEFSTRQIFDVIDKSTKAHDGYYLMRGTKEYEQLSRAITDENQIYRFSDYGIQSSRNGISFTLKANMGTWPNRIPFIKDAFGIRKITPKECLALQGFPPAFSFPKMPIASAYKQAGNTVVVPVVKKIAQKIGEAVGMVRFDEALDEYEKVGGV